jgi:futalosine hydrolase
MRVLVVAATDGELVPVGTRPPSDNTTIDRLITGVGMVATAAAVARALARTPYDVAINLGVCGAFDRAMALGTVVHVLSDQVSELGVEDGPVFRAAHEMGLTEADTPPLTGGRLINTHPPDSAILRSLPQVRGITVNTVHGDDASIAAVRARLDPDVESMEGAAFMYACLTAGVPFAQVRAVSNHVERRNRAAWQLPQAIAALGAAATALISEL